MKRRFALGLLVLSLLACNYVTRMIVPPTATVAPTATIAATATPLASETPVPLVPAFVPAECQSMPLATVVPDTLTQLAPNAEEDNPKISTTQQLKILRDTENIIEKVYIYPDYNGKDWNEIKSRYRAKIAAGLDTQAFYTEMQSMITELGDEHSFFLSPFEVKQQEEELSGDLEFVGVGVYANFDYDHGRVVVITTFPDSSADHAGIKSHDSILAVDGMPVFDEKNNRIRGPKCSVVVATVQTPGEEPRQVVLVRHTIEGNLRVEARLVATTDGSKIGYLFIPSFFDETIPPQIEKALNDFGPLDGLILDVRMNGGGSSVVVDPIMSFFASGNLGKFVSRDRSRTLKIDPNPIQNSQTVPLVVMVSKDTVSYGEIFAGIMRDVRGAKITGETSLGNVELLHGFDFDDGSQMWLASERFVPQRSKENWEDTGIVTDIEAFAPWDTFTFETDPSIAAALTLLGHK